MGLVDKVLETFKQWVNLDVEDVKDAETEGARSVYHIAIQQHKDAVVAHEQAIEFANETPGNAMAKTMVVIEANKAQIKLTQAESKAKKI
jgi:hypothetical protein